jgi:hypothetical protein
MRFSRQNAIPCPLAPRNGTAPRSIQVKARRSKSALAMQMALQRLFKEADRLAP